MPVMDSELLQQARKELARLGGLARANSMTVKERHELAKKAAKAAGIARSKRARAKKKAEK